MKEISDQEVGEYLKRLNRWWSGPPGIDEDTDRLTPRAYLPPLRSLLTDATLRRAVVLLGPRRVGKTILIRHLIRELLAEDVVPTRIGYVEVDHPLLHGQSLESLVQQMRAASGDDGQGLRYLFFDVDAAHGFSFTSPTCR